jgi:pimeloyl-ACP methyl ester carboxylesterase
MYLKDVLGALDVPLLTPSLISDGGDDGDGDGALTVTAAARRLAAAVAALPEDRPVRLIGSSLGAYVAAVYASDPENAKRVDRMMLLAPTFKPSACLETVEREMGVSLGDAFREDLENHPDFPFAPCRAYVVHGYDDEASPLENSLTWVRDASVNLREGTGEAGEVAERRLLEVAGVENALPQIKSRLVDFFKLPFTVQGP